MVITPKSDDKADILFTPIEMEKMMSVTSEIVELLNRRYDGCPLTQLLVYIGFFTGNMARWFSQNVVDKDGTILSEEQFADLICNQAKSFMQQMPSL